jgi:hypothetical protein
MNINDLIIDQLTDEQIVKFFNQAIEAESGHAGTLTPGIFDFEDLEYQYKSATDETIITLTNVSIFMEFDNETVTLGSKDGLNNFRFYY